MAELSANDEFFKMSMTDALSKALSWLGFGADIYMGRHDGSKYIDEPPPAADEKENPIETESLDSNDTMVLDTSIRWPGAARDDFLKLILRGVSAYGQVEFETRVARLLTHGDYNADKICKIDFEKDGHRLYDDITNMLKAHEELKGEEK